MTETKKIVSDLADDLDAAGLDTDPDTDTDTDASTTVTRKLQNFRELSRFCNVRFITTSGELYFHAWMLAHCSKVFDDILASKPEKFGETFDIQIDARYSADVLNIILNIIQNTVRPSLDDIEDDVGWYTVVNASIPSIPMKEEVCAIMRQYDIDGWEYILSELQYHNGPISVGRINRMRALSLNIITKNFATSWALGKVKLAGDITGDLLQEICLLAKESMTLENLMWRPWILFENLDPKNTDEKYINAIVTFILGEKCTLEEIKPIHLERFNSAKLTGIVPAIWDAVATELCDWDWEAITSASMKPGMEIYRRFLDHFVEEPADGSTMELLKDPSS